MDNKQPKVINKSGTTKLTDEAMAAKEAKAEKDFKGRRRDNRRNRLLVEHSFLRPVLQLVRVLLQFFVKTRYHIIQLASFHY